MSVRVGTVSQSEKRELTAPASGLVPSTVCLARSIFAVLAWIRLGEGSSNMCSRTGEWQRDVAMDPEILLIAETHNQLLPFGGNSNAYHGLLCVVLIQIDNGSPDILTRQNTRRRHDIEVSL